MATKFLGNYYSYKVLSKRPRVPAAEADPGAALERQVQARLESGHQAFFRDEFQAALQEYQTAYSLLHKFLHPSFPAEVSVFAPDLLRDLKATDLMMAATAQVAKFRAAVGNRPIVAPVDPPKDVSAIVERLGSVGTAAAPSPAAALYQQASSYLQAGATDEARPLIKRAMALNAGKDRDLEVDLLVTSGVAALQRQDFGEAQEAFQKASQLTAQGNSAPRPARLAAISNNLGVLATLTGDARTAGAAFQAAGDAVPLSLGRSLTQPFDSGTAAALQRPMGGEGLGLILGSATEGNSWLSVSPGVAATAGAEQLGVFAGDRTKRVKLQGDAAANLKAEVYEPRIHAASLRELATFEAVESNFLAYIPHTYGFTLPLSLGDCYVEMGEFDQAILWYLKARDYEFLNQPIEAPAVWLKLANAFVRWGDFLFESGRKEEATTTYEQVVRLSAPFVDLASPLYATPVFDPLAAQVLALLAAPQPPDPDVHNPAIAAVVLLAKLNLQNLEDGIDFPLLGLAPEQIPVFRFDYLQNVARYFAEHAIGAERTYIQFKTSAEQEEFSRAMLQNAVDLERANEALEAKRVEIAQEQREAVEANQDYAEKQLQNARNLKAEYAQVSLQEIALDSEITYVGAPTTEYDFSGYEGYGISNGSHRVDEVLRTLTRRRREISREFELHNLDRHIGELDAARRVADEQVDVAIKQKQAADLQKNIATLRRQQAEQQVALFDSQEFTPDLWNRLANEMREISRSYLDQAIVIARLMEQAYEFEVGKRLGIIKPSYTRNDLSGLLAGDFLLRDIDSFTFLRIVLGEKKQPVKEIISLADRYPVQFLRDFQRTGRMGFRTELSDFDRCYPGSYQQRIKRVEVIVEGLIGREGLHASLTNTGLCLTRTRDGRIKLRLLQPETLLISRYRLGADALVFPPDNEMLAIFEHAPVSTTWIFELSPAANDIVLNYITDVKLVLHYEAFFDPNLKPLVLEELAVEQISSGRRTVALRYEMFDEFFAFQDMGEVTFALRPEMLPFYQTDPRIRELTILVQTEDGVSPQGLAVRVRAADGTSATQATTADGALSTGGGGPLDAFAGKPWLQEWTIAVPRADNQARFDAGFQWSQVRNLIVTAEYEFTPRRIPGEPFLLLRDRFDQDPLARFDVVDDPQANAGAPSDWSFNAAEQRVEQSSNIHGGPDGPADTDPVKPGTYLVRKITAEQPAVRDFLVACDAGSEIGGGIGLVFRWQDADNFYYFLMDSARGFRRLGKKIGGVFQELDTAAVDTGHGYDADTAYALRVRASGSSLEAYLNGDLVLAGQDASLPDAGRAGLFCWGGASARFDNFQIIEI